jgi:predicted ester cyclase
MAPPSSLELIYLSYVAALNERPFPGLADHVHPIVALNDVSMPLAEYEKLLTDDIDAAPDLHFELSMLVVDESTQRVGCRIEFRCTPMREFMGRNVQGTIKCMEHMFYQYREGKIANVWWMPGELVAAESNGTITKL